MPNDDTDAQSAGNKQSVRVPRRERPSLFALDAPNFETDGRDWPNRATSRFVDAAGIRWHVQEMGQAGRPVLWLIHGTGGATHSYRDLGPILATAFHVFIPDLPGHGFTSGVQSSRLSLPEMARALSQLIRAVGASPDLAVGHSAGAAVLIRATLSGQIAPKAIIGINAALMPFQGLAQHLFPAAARLLVLNPFVPRLASWSASERMVTRLLEGTGSKLDAFGIALYRRLFAKPGHCAAALGMMARWELEPLLRALPKLSARLDLIIGTKDLAVPPGDATELQRSLPSLHVHQMMGLGHLSHEEDPAQAAEIIRSVAKDSGILATA